VWDCGKGLCWCKVLISEDIGIVRIDACAGETRAHQLWSHGCHMCLHVLWNDIVMVHMNVFVNAVIALHLPMMLYLSKNYDIEGLELMGTFGGESEDKDVVLICSGTEPVSFVRIMTIEKEEDRVFIYLVGAGKWDEGLLKPFEAQLVVGPPIG
jgi:hypothetical protein